MFWDDIKEIKDWMASISSRLTHIQMDNVIQEKLEGVEECIHDTFNSEDKYSAINRIHDKLDSLVRDADRVQAVLLAEQTLDKFNDYMKNVDKLNAMINEFKGTVSLARGAIAERKQLDEEVKEMKKVADLSHQIHRSMLAFIRAGDNLESKHYFKLEAIYKAVCEPKEEKSPKKRKSAKKKAKSVSPAP